MTQVKVKKTKYASKVEEQIVDAIKSGKSLSGKRWNINANNKKSLRNSIRRRNG